MRDFRKLEIWKESIQLVKEIYLISERLPNDERFGLRSQIQRASVSIPSNIAEGASRTSEKEFKYFLEIALGSAFELETQMILINAVFVKEKIIDDIVFTQLNTIQKQLNALITKIKSDSFKNKKG